MTYMIFLRCSTEFVDQHCQRSPKQHVKSVKCISNNDSICHCNFLCPKQTAKIFSIFSNTPQAASSYQEMISNPATPKLDVKIAEMRLTWLVFIIGSAVGGRVSFNSNDEHDAMDGELVCR